MNFIEMPCASLFSHFRQIVCHCVFRRVCQIVHVKPATPRQQIVPATEADPNREGSVVLKDSVMKTRLVNVVPVIFHFVLVVFAHYFRFAYFCHSSNRENIMAKHRADLVSARSKGSVSSLV